MERLWDYCAFCGKRIETGEMCYGLPNGESVCTDCCVAENEGAAVSDGEEEQEAMKDVWVKTLPVLRRKGAPVCEQRGKSNLHKMLCEHNGSERRIRVRQQRRRIVGRSMEQEG